MPIKSSRYSNLSILPIFSVGVLFVLCVASPRKNLSQGPSIGGFGFNLCFIKVKIMLSEQGKLLIGCLGAKATRTKTPVPAIIF